MACRSSWTRDQICTTAVTRTTAVTTSHPSPAEPPETPRFFGGFFFFWPCPQYAEVSGPGIKPKPQQGQHWILNTLSHQGTLVF